MACDAPFGIYLKPSARGFYSLTYKFMSLEKYKLSSLGDKINQQAEAQRAKIEKVKEKVKKPKEVVLGGVDKPRKKK